MPKLNVALVTHQQSPRNHRALLNCRRFSLGSINYGDWWGKSSAKVRACVCLWPTGSSVSLLWASREGTVALVAPRAINPGKCASSSDSRLSCRNKEGRRRITSSCQQKISQSSSLTCTTSFSLSLSWSISSLFVCSLFTIPFWRVLFLSAYFSSHLCRGSSHLLSFGSGSTSQPLSPRAVRTMRIRKGWRRTKWEGHSSPCANALLSLVVLPLIPGSAGIMDLGAHQTHFHTALEKERGFFDYLRYPPSRYYFNFLVWLLQLVQNLAVNWKVLPGLHKGIPASTRFTLTWRWSLVLPAWVWLHSGSHHMTPSNKWDGIAQSQRVKKTNTHFKVLGDCLLL